MRKIILTIGLLSMSILSCTDEAFDGSLNGSWTVFSFENLITGATEFKTQENSWNMNINIQFDDTKSPKIISGTNTTNQVLGEFSYIEQNQFRVSSLMSTRVSQPKWADEFTRAIQDQDLTFKIAKNQLVIYYENNSKSMTLNRY
jgi:hypothetical protein